MSTVRTFIERHFLHYNAREVVRAARAWEAHVQQGGKMLLTLAGAMSTAQMGILISRLIREGWVHGVCCTGANLEEDVFTLLEKDHYVPIDNWRSLSADDEAALLERGLNRVTDTCIPESVMRHVEQRLHHEWNRASAAGERLSPAEFLWRVLDDPELPQHFQGRPEDCWLLTAKNFGIPVYTPGWEDSTTGNMFAAAVIAGRIPNHDMVISGTAQMQRLAQWYLDNCRPEGGGPSVGFFQIGGGIAGDFPICVVPMLYQDLQMHDIPTWGYFCQISDAVTSYGGYSGAVPNEKITWGKLSVDTPRFMIESDATIVAPLIFAWLLQD